MTVLHGPQSKVNIMLILKNLCMYYLSYLQIPCTSALRRGPRSYYVKCINTVLQVRITIFPDIITINYSYYTTRQSPESNYSLTVVAFPLQRCRPVVMYTSLSRVQLSLERTKTL